MKEINGFSTKHAHDLKRGEFFFFPNGRKRMVCEEIQWPCQGLVFITATSPKGKTVKRSFFGCKSIYVYN